MNEERIVAALRALAESDRDREASPAVETRVRRGFRRQHVARLWRRAAIWTTAAAAVVLAVSLWKSGQPRPEPAPAVTSVQPVPQTVIPVQSAPVVAKPRRKAVAARQTAPREVVTEFFPLTDVALPFERGELVRVRLPASALRTIGLPVDEDRLGDRIQADVLVGEEGLARAIRFVKSQERF